MTPIHQDQKLTWIANLRCIATIGVISLHVAAPILYQYHTLSTNTWWIGNLYDSTVRCCVPIFVMITGALLLSKEESIGVFLKKRFLRIVLPFIFWSLFYISINLILKLQNNEIITLTETIKWVFSELSKGSSFHLWYVYMIIGVYLIVPIIGKFVRNANEKEILYFLIIWFITIISQLPFIVLFKLHIELTYFSGYIGYLVLGYYLSLKKIDCTKIISYTLLLTGILVTAIGTYLLSVKNNRFTETLYNYLTPNVAMAASGLFILIQNQKIQTKTLSPIRDLINRYSYGIYLIHIFVLTVLHKAGIDYTFIHPLIGIPITTVICLTLSLFTIYILNKIKYINYVAG